MDNGAFAERIPRTKTSYAIRWDRSAKCHVLKNDKFATSAISLHLPLKGYSEEGDSMMLLEENPEIFDSFWFSDALTKC